MLAGPAQRFAQASDVNIDGAVFDIDIVSPHAVQKLFAREHPPRALQQIFQQTKFGRAERDLLPGTKDAAALAVELDVARARIAATRSGLARRSSAPIRAISSGTENGLTT